MILAAALVWKPWGEVRPGSGVDTVSSFYVWAGLDRAHDYRKGDPVPDGAGAYLYGAESLEAALDARIAAPSDYVTAAGEPAPLYIAAGDLRGACIVSGPIIRSAGEKPTARYRPGLSAFVSLECEAFECVRCGAPNAEALDGGDLIVCEGCV